MMVPRTIETITVRRSCGETADKVDEDSGNGMSKETAIISCKKDVKTNCTRLFRQHVAEPDCSQYISLTRFESLYNVRQLHTLYFTQ